MKPGSKAWKNFMAKLYGIGAAVVILGALFKIMHWPGAGAMLVVGLGTEAVIFLFSAFEPLGKEFDWSRVYPELAGGDANEKENKGSLSQQLDAMLEDAKIEPELIHSLGSGLRSLSDQTNKLSDITDASVATREYVDSVVGASRNVSELSRAYTQASEGLITLTENSDPNAAKNFGVQLQKISHNLSSLNDVYELQLKGSSASLEASNRMQDGITDLMKNLNDSVEDTRLYKENMSLLSKNLAALNTVYGNMLSAMTVRSE